MIRFINQNNRNLYWAFGLVAGSWIISLAISGVLLIVGREKETTQGVLETHQLKQFASDSEFRNYFIDLQREYSLPAELPSVATLSALTNNQPVIFSRMIDGSSIQEVRTEIYNPISCPLSVLGTISVPCTGIWYPDKPVSADSVFTITEENSVGQIEKQMSFIGVGDQTDIVVSDTYFYIPFISTVKSSQRTIQFFLETNNSLVDEITKSNLSKVMEMNISEKAKQAEVETILLRFANGLADSERLKWESSRDSQMAVFLSQHGRDFEKTVIAKFSLNDFSLQKIGEIPGRPIKELSLNEYEGNVRIATEFGDIYELNQDLQIVDTFTGLGEIHSVLFEGNNAYISTLVETDKLKVLNLLTHDSKTLPVSGFSSKLHALDNGLLLVVTREESHSKLLLFDSNTLFELDSFVLRDYWSQLLPYLSGFTRFTSNHEFFIPREKGGYLFSYQDNKLVLNK
jgi:uncharacterized secreted protein with C-terminal beta-propeller domain